MNPIETAFHDVHWTSFSIWTPPQSLLIKNREVWSSGAGEVMVMGPFTETGCSLGIGDRRTLRLLLRILQLMFGSL